MPPTRPPSPRAIRTEKKTVAAMVHLYCRERHADARARESRDAHAGPDAAPNDAGLCASCQSLLAYSHARLDGCPYGESKPSCRDCPVHCYRPAEKEAMRHVMRATGPKMLLRHPWLAIVHLWKERRRETPPPPPKRAKPQT